MTNLATGRPLGYRFAHPYPKGTILDLTFIPKYKAQRAHTTRWEVAGYLDGSSGDRDIVEVWLVEPHSNPARRAEVCEKYRIVDAGTVVCTPPMHEEYSYAVNVVSEGSGPSYGPDWKSNWLER